jgi:hypothetical protein
MVEHTLRPLTADEQKFIEQHVLFGVRERGVDLQDPAAIDAEFSQGLAAVVQGAAPEDIAQNLVGVTGAMLGHHLCMKHGLVRAMDGGGDRNRWVVVSQDEHAVFYPFDTAAKHWRAQETDWMPDYAAQVAEALGVESVSGE